MAGRGDTVCSVADPVGLSIGTTNLVAVRAGTQPVTRRSVLTLYDQRPPEVGLSAENPNLTEPGLVMRGFVERVGDPVPLVASDGSSHLAERLLVDALGAMADTVGASSDLAIAVPAYWGSATVRALSDALARDPKLAPTGAPPRLVSDAVAALIALQTEPGLTDDGAVVLLDFGGSGTSITLVDATGGFQPIGETVRYPEFSGDQIDQAVLSAVVAQVTGADDADPAATAAVGSLTRLRDECRQAKERLSAETVTGLAVDLPVSASEIRFTRTELEGLIRPAAGRCHPSRRGSVAAQRPNVVRRVDRRHRGRRRQYSSRHATSLRTKPGPCYYHGPAWGGHRHRRGATGRALRRGSADGYRHGRWRRRDHRIRRSRERRSGTGVVAGRRPHIGAGALHRGESVRHRADRRAAACRVHPADRADQHPRTPR